MKKTFKHLLFTALLASTTPSIAQNMVQWNSNQTSNYQINGTHPNGTVNAKIIAPQNILIQNGPAASAWPIPNDCFNTTYFTGGYSVNEWFVTVGPYNVIPNNTLGKIRFTFNTPVLVKGLYADDIDMTLNGSTFNDSFEVESIEFHNSFALNCSITNHTTCHADVNLSIEGEAGFFYSKNYVSSFDIQTLIVNNSSSAVIGWALEVIAPEHIIPLAICEPTTYTIQPTNEGNYNYHWWVPDGAENPGATNTITISSPGIYYVDIINNTTNEIEETFAIDAQFALQTPEFHDLPQYMCEGRVLELPNPSDNLIYGNWSHTLENGVAVYTFTPTTDCATTYTYEVDILENHTPTFAIPDQMCIGETFALPATSLEGFSGIWLPVYNPMETTTYTFYPDLRDQICVASVSHTIEITGKTPTFSPISICYTEFEQLELPTISQEGITGQWNFIGETNLTYDYLFVPEANQCAFTTSFAVIKNPNLCSIQKGISPNQDGLNDCFDLEKYPVAQLDIYNRYGTLVYSKKDYKKEWIGQSNEQEMLPSGTYFYSIQLYSNFENITGWIYLSVE